MFDCRHPAFQLPAEILAALEKAYAEPQRAYHNATHINEVLGWYDSVYEELGWFEEREVYAAILFHDAIYQPGARDNEARSAAWARDVGLPANGARVAYLIEMTARHGSIEVADRDAALFLDCDMAILGSSPEQFAAYDAAIAHEYSVLPPDVYRAGRRAFLERLLATPRIYLTEYFHSRLEKQARANLEAALKT
jgi:predicted metal-dependent HD superfamily phosphohydrolase